MFNFKCTLFFTFLMVLINNVSFCTSDDSQEPITDELRTAEPDDADDTTTTNNEEIIPVPSKGITPKDFAKGLTLIRDDYTGKLDTVRRLVNESLATQDTDIKNIQDDIKEIQGTVKDLRDNVNTGFDGIIKRFEKKLVDSYVSKEDMYTSTQKQDASMQEQFAKYKKDFKEETTADLNNYFTMFNTSNTEQKALYDNKIGTLTQEIADLKKAPSINPNVLQKQVEEATRGFLLRNDLPLGRKVNEIIEKNNNRHWSTANSTVDFISENKELVFMGTVLAIHLIHTYCPDSYKISAPITRCMSFIFNTISSVFSAKSNIDKVDTEETN